MEDSCVQTVIRQKICDVIRAFLTGMGVVRLALGGRTPWFIESREEGQGCT